MSKGLIVLLLLSLSKLDGSQVDTKVAVSTPQVVQQQQVVSIEDKDFMEALKVFETSINKRYSEEIKDAFKFESCDFSDMKVTVSTKYDTGNEQIVEMIYYLGNFIYAEAGTYRVELTIKTPDLKEGYSVYLDTDGCHDTVSEWNALELEY